MKHISYNREQTGKCYFEDTTIFLSDSEEDTMRQRKSMLPKQKTRTMKPSRNLRIILNSTFKVESLLASLSQKEV